MEEKIYTCECGKTFTKPNAFNGHKSSCKIHQVVKYGNLDKLNERNLKAAKNCSNTAKLKAEVKKQTALDIWISEQHTCEKCGKVMTEKFGSGRFCSQSCANSRKHTEATKSILSQRAKCNPTGWAALDYITKSNNIKNHSKRELEIVNLLKENFPADDWKIGFVPNNKVNDIYINPDMHSDKLKIVIEYDGIWHFKNICNQLEHKQLVDRETVNWCKKHNYRLIRIDEDLNITNEQIINAIYNSDVDLELFGSNRYSYLFK